MASSKEFTCPHINSNPILVVNTLHKSCALIKVRNTSFNMLTSPWYRDFALVKV